MLSQTKFNREMLRLLKTPEKELLEEYKAYKEANPKQDNSMLKKTREQENFETLQKTDLLGYKLEQLSLEKKINLLRKQRLIGAINIVSYYFYLMVMKIGQINNIFINKINPILKRIVNKVGVPLAIFVFTMLISALAVGYFASMFLIMPHLSQAAAVMLGIISYPLFMGSLLQLILDVGTMFNATYNQHLENDFQAMRDKKSIFYQTFKNIYKTNLELIKIIAKAISILSNVLILACFALGLRAFTISPLTSINLFMAGFSLTSIREQGRKEIGALFLIMGLFISGGAAALSLIFAPMYFIPSLAAGLSISGIASIVKHTYLQQSAARAENLLHAPNITPISTEEKDTIKQILLLAAAFQRAPNAMLDNDSIDIEVQRQTFEDACECLRSAIDDAKVHKYNDSLYHSIMDCIKSYEYYPNLRQHASFKDLFIINEDHNSFEFLDKEARLQVLNNLCADMERVLKILDEMQAPSAQDATNIQQESSKRNMVFSEKGLTRVKEGVPGFMNTEFYIDRETGNIKSKSYIRPITSKPTPKNRLA